ncbi:hypothetical protein [Gordonia rhizosphera]|nr:hypothetical protein [Gordonia rhizosphera]
MSQPSGDPSIAARFVVVVGLEFDGDRQYSLMQERCLIRIDGVKN